MTSFFYVLALPRSMTLWLSFLLTDDESVCYHEALTDFKDKKLTDSGKKYTGSIDTNPLNEVNYNGNLVVVKRDLKDVIESLKQNFTQSHMGEGEYAEFIDGYAKKYADALNKKEAYIIEFKDLMNAEKVLDMARFLKPETNLSIGRIKYMQQCHIQTKNNDLTVSIMALDKNINAQRTLDVGVCLSVLTDPDIFDSISEDGATINDVQIDVINHYWVSLAAGGELIGVVQFKPITSHLFESHIHILKQHRKEHTANAGAAILDWCKDNLAGTLYAHTPDYCVNVINFLEKFDFIKCGTIPKAWNKNGKLNDLVILARGL